MTEPIYAYTWFRRPGSSSPGNWRVCTAAQMASIVKLLRMHKKQHNLQPGEVLHALSMRTSYDYIFVQTPLPLGLINGLEEV